MATLIARASSVTTIIPRRISVRRHQIHASDLEKLVRARCSSGSLGTEEALGHFTSLIELRPLPSVGVFNRLLGSLYDARNYSLVVSLYRALTGFFPEFSPESATLNFVANSYSGLGRPELGFSVYAAAVKLGLQWDPHTLCNILHELCSRGSMAMAAELFEEMARNEHPGHEFSYGILINGLCRAGESSKAFELLRAMCRGQITKKVKPDSGCFCPVINAFFAEGRAEEALGLFDAMTGLRISPDSATCNSLLRWLCKLGRWDEAEKSLTNLQSNHGFSPNLRTYNILIDCLCKADRTDEALSLFNLVPNPDVVTFNALLSGLCRLGRWDRVEELSRAMERLGVSPDEATYAPIVDGLCKEGRLEEAARAVEEMTEKGVGPTNAVVYNSVIRGLCVRGWWRDALRVLGRMEERGVRPCGFTFHILAFSLRRQGREMEALKLLRYMIETGLLPDHRLRDMFASLLATFPRRRAKYGITSAPCKDTEPDCEKG